MKGIFLFSFLLISSVALAQQSGIEPFPTDTANLSYGNHLLENNSFLKMKQPKINLDDDFYTLLKAPNLANRYTKGSLLIKRPKSIPEMPVAPLDPINDFYLLDLDTELIPSKEE